MLNRNEVYIRDPFVVPDYDQGKYYLFGTTDKNCWGDEKATGFDYYISTDLEKFTGPYPAFRPPEGFWADRNFWAPEVHYYQGKYYMFATFITDGRKRGTQILTAEEITGPYLPDSKEAITPPDWMCLDGTFFMDEEGNPWMVFCHEWVETYDGEIWAMRLSSDLKTAAGKPVILFRASEAPWTRSIRVIDGQECFVTDGPYLYRTENNKLLMLWSSFIEDNTYAIGIAYSQSGNISGPWIHEDRPLYSQDAGHGMIFKTLEGGLKLAIHKPNKKEKERPVFIDLVDVDDRLALK